jgi:hypothetical protein
MFRLLARRSPFLLSSSSRVHSLVYFLYLLARYSGEKFVADLLQFRSFWRSLIAARSGSKSTHGVCRSVSFADFRPNPHENFAMRVDPTGQGSSLRLCIIPINQDRVVALRGRSARVACACRG